MSIEPGPAVALPVTMPSTGHPAASPTAPTGVPLMAPSDYETLLAAIEHELDDVDRALHRLHDGTYGACEVCGGSIGEDRLVAVPTLRRCDEHDA